MALEGSLLGWIEPLDACRFVGAFVGEDALADPARDYAGRAPATKICVSPDEARHWVERQAADLGLPVKWMPGAPRKAFVFPTSAPVGFDILRVERAVLNNPIGDLYVAALALHRQA